MKTLIKKVYIYIFAGIITPFQSLYALPNSGALIIIDMQPEFHATLDYNLVDRVIKEAEKAMAKSWPIYLVETEPELFGLTLRSIKETVAGYPELVEIIKEDSDGSPAIIDDLREYELLPDEIRFCGVNTGLCVLTTINGISMEFQKKRLKITLVERGCSDADTTRHQRALSLASKFPGVEVEYGCTSD